MMNNNKIEGYTNFQDVKTKTLNWCSKMKDIGLLTTDQFNTCASNFTDSTSGLMPKNFSDKSSTMGVSYSLYNTKTKKLSSNLSGEDTNIIMLVTNSGLYMACNSNNNIYYVSNIDDPKINQNELYFTLTPQANNIYALLSPYGKFLITNTSWGAEFSGTAIGPLSTWNLSKIDEGDTSKVLIESIQYKNFYLSFTGKDIPLQIINGQNDSTHWLMIPKSVSQNSDKYSEFTGSDYLITKDNILTSIANRLIEKSSLENLKLGFDKLKESISSNYIKIETYMKQKLEYGVQLYKLSNEEYKNNIESLNKSSTIPKDKMKSLVESIPKPSGLNITTNDINSILYNISNTKNTYLRLIDQEISTLNNTLASINERSNPIDDYHKYIKDVKSEIANVSNRISQNQTIMDRQKNTYNTINQDVAYINTKYDKYKDLDNTLKLNLNIVNGYKTQSSLLVKMYPYIVIILILGLIYLIYLTVLKFKANIYEKY